jgi:hypothetical protein
MNTVLTIEDDLFLINGKLTYSENSFYQKGCQGLLLNARFIQAIFDNKSNRLLFSRFGRSFNPLQNTKDLIEALPDWYSAGLRAITIGLQGGGPCFTMDAYSLDNNPYSPDGFHLDQEYLDRLEMILTAADNIGMVVIVNYFYGAMVKYLKDEIAIMQAVDTISTWLREKGYKNLIIEIANEYDTEGYANFPILHTEEGIVSLMKIARRASGGLPVSCSPSGGAFSDVIAQNSDVILIHGNDQTRQELQNLINRAKKIQPTRPIVCNEDSASLAQMPVAVRNGVSWGYYNNLSKQEPPTDWGICNGEDRFFALRMKEILGQEKVLLPRDEQILLQGLKQNEGVDAKRWIRLSSLYPEQIDYVDFYRDGKYVTTAYDSPFMINMEATWKQAYIADVVKGEVWKAEVFFSDGERLSLLEIAD